MSLFNQYSVLRILLTYESSAVPYTVNSERHLSSLVEEIERDLSNEDDWVVRMKGLEKIQGLCLGNAHELPNAISIIKRLGDLVSFLFISRVFSAFF